MTEKEEKHKMYAVGYRSPAEELAAEFNLFNTLKAFMESDQLPDGTFVKFIRADFALAQAEEKVPEVKSKIIMPDTGFKGLN